MTKLRIFTLLALWILGCIWSYNLYYSWPFPYERQMCLSYLAFVVFSFLTLRRLLRPELFLTPVTLVRKTPQRKQ